MTPDQLAHAAKCAADYVERATGTPAHLARGPILDALLDADAEARCQAAERFMCGYWCTLAGAVVLGLAWWAWP